MVDLSSDDEDKDFDFCNNSGDNEVFNLKCDSETESQFHESEIQLVAIRPKSKSRLVTPQMSTLAGEAQIVAEKEDFFNLEEKTGYIKVYLPITLYSPTNQTEELFYFRV